MQHVLGIDENKMFLMPCHPAGARELLRKGKAAVYKRCPFRIIFKEKSGSDVQDLQLKLDPGSKTTTIVRVAECQQGRKVVGAGELTHRGQAMRNTLLCRRQIRRSRRLVLSEPFQVHRGLSPFDSHHQEDQPDQGADQETSTVKRQLIG
jgi:hypothetical protein